MANFASSDDSSASLAPPREIFSLSAAAAAAAADWQTIDLEQCRCVNPMILAYQESPPPLMIDDELAPPPPPPPPCVDSRHGDALLARLASDPYLLNSAAFGGDFHGAASWNCYDSHPDLQAMGDGSFAFAEESVDNSSISGQNFSSLSDHLQQQQQQHHQFSTRFSQPPAKIQRTSKAGFGDESQIEPQSVAARHRRKKISERVRSLEKLVPGGSKMDTASMLEEAIRYVKFLQAQVQLLEGLDQNLQARSLLPFVISEELQEALFRKRCVVASMPQI